MGKCHSLGLFPLVFSSGKGNNGTKLTQEVLVGILLKYMLSLQAEFTKFKVSAHNYLTLMRLEV